MTTLFHRKKVKVSKIALSPEFSSKHQNIKNKLMGTQTFQRRRKLDAIRKEK